MVRRALLIGVSEYGEGFEALPGSLLDVRGMAAVLGNAEQGAFDELKALENPERLEMEAATGQFFQDCAADDLLLFYFSGHGDLGVSVAQQQLHFCVKGSQKVGKRLQEWTAISAEALKRQMSLCRSRQIVVILDCCYSGAIADLLRKGETGSAFDELKAEGRVILASSSASESSYQAVDGFSLYTHYLLEGMMGAALPQEKRGEWIVARDLHGYAERRFEVEHQGGVSPKIIVARDEGYELPLVKAPKADPKVAYQLEVDRIFQELDEELGLEFDGEINEPLDRGSLETLERKLGLERSVALQIEEKVQAPYLKRAKQRGEYRRYFEQAVADDKLLTKRQRRRLGEIRENLGLGEGDAEAIEKIITLRKAAVRVLAEPWEPAPTAVDETETAIISAENSSESKLIWLEFETLKVDAKGKVTDKLNRKVQQFVEDIGNGVALEMVRIPGGEFLMGAAKGEEGASDDEYPQHRVTVPEFYMGKFSVTQAQYRVLMGQNPSFFKGAQRPVEQVSWNKSQEFCQKLSQQTGRKYRLPSEAEWEYACRAGMTQPFYVGATINSELANYRSNVIYAQGPDGQYREQTTDVDSFSPNAFGLHDMHGNVYEWCADRWHSNYDGAPTDGSAWMADSKDAKLYVLRGGSWISYPWFCRSATRSSESPNSCNGYFGFRVVCMASPGMF